MSMEPETMIPMVFLDPKHIVLIGDHRQLGPVVMEDCAKTFGLETSLFERHCSRAVMLTEQYRMVKNLLNFNGFSYHIA